MGGDSASSNTNTTVNTNTSGSNAAQGDNLGSMISGVNDSTINSTTTDHGAVEGSLDLAGDVIESMTNVVGGALENNSNIFENALDSVNAGAGQAASNAKDTLSFASELAKSAMTDNQSETNQQMIKIVLGISSIVGLVLIVKFWKKK